LVEKADVAAEVTKKDRTEIVTEALREYLNDIEDDETFTEAVVELYLEPDRVRSHDADDVSFRSGSDDLNSVRQGGDIDDDSQSRGDPGGTGTLATESLSVQSS
jgi:hypothetical protein